jgi:hypothetical protein
MARDCATVDGAWAWIAGYLGPHTADVAVVLWLESDSDAAMRIAVRVTSWDQDWDGAANAIARHVALSVARMRGLAVWTAEVGAPHGWPRGHARRTRPLAPTCDPTSHWHPPAHARRSSHTRRGIVQSPSEAWHPQGHRADTSVCPRPTPHTGSRAQIGRSTQARVTSGGRVEVSATRRAQTHPRACAVYSLPRLSRPGRAPRLRARRPRKRPTHRARPRVTSPVP